MSLVSIIVPSFNGGGTLHTPVRSIAAQTHRDIELIIVDDGSTDHTRAVAEKLVSGVGVPARIVGHDRNLGLSHARNTGLAHAGGEWIQFLDSDDCIAPTKIAAQIAVAASAGHATASVYSPFQTFAIKGGESAPVDPWLFPDVEEAHPVAFLLAHSFVHLSATLTRRTAMQAVGGFRQDAVPWEDDEIKVRMALAGHRFIRVPTAEPAFFWRVYPEQQRWGGENARYRIGRVADGFLAAVKLALRGAAPDEAALPAAVLAEVEDQLTSQVRLMYRHDRQTGDGFLRDVLAYHPRFRPSRPLLSGPVSRLLGVRRFERMVADVRGLRSGLWRPDHGAPNR
ncbi:glycosyltransferase family 2 protein [Plastoroseomonas arctica]|uniref:Glycosyltransferase family 2 protein n=1 Tax=Plastoroseomonas arctica TaxID=1509237 RepID=A0AAF1K5F8_9PROT|nr:glycosyltransferase family A protein [Plastoroseomonas arctica]MBR0656480.1 glycosyltransferase family 2 protein [Plastoroseomonas arctica]